MLSLPPSVRVFVHREGCDMRKGFYSLAALVRDAMKEDPLSGHLFVFFGRSRRSVKVLLWDRSGYCLWYKKLERGTFSAFDKMKSNEIDWGTLVLLLEGIEPRTVKRRPRFSLQKDAA